MKTVTEWHQRKLLFIAALFVLSAAAMIYLGPERDSIIADFIRFQFPFLIAVYAPAMVASSRPRWLWPVILLCALTMLAILIFGAYSGDTRLFSRARDAWLLAWVCAALSHVLPGLLKATRQPARQRLTPGSTGPTTTNPSHGASKPTRNNVAGFSANTWAALALCVLAQYLLFQGVRIAQFCKVEQVQGRAYVVQLPESRFLIAHSDGPATRGSSRLFENGKALGPAHSSHETIRQQGGGLFSHWGSDLVFSTPDGSDPRQNGRTYVFETQYFLAGPYRHVANLGLAIVIMLLLSSRAGTGPFGPVKSWLNGAHRLHIQIPRIPDRKTWMGLALVVAVAVLVAISVLDGSDIYRLTSWHSPVKVPIDLHGSQPACCWAQQRLCAAV